MWSTKKEHRNAPDPALTHYRIYGLNSFKHKLNATDPKNIYELENCPERIRGIAGERIPSRNIKLEVGHRLIDFVSPGAFRRFGDDRVS